MSDSPAPPSLLAAASPSRESLAAPWTRRLAALSEFANPILVKETRQALKSRQFIVTFLIVLVGCWIASFGVIAYIGPQIRYSAAGPELFLWYYGILAAALAIVVPFSAFRSLAAEQEDNTFDLLSITTLSARRIIAGKLCSAIAQILIYVSAAAPFMAFTFLLRGIDVLTVAVLLLVAVAGSIGLAAVGLLVGAASRVRHTQVLISVAFVLGLVFAAAGAVGLASQFLRESQYVLRDVDFWLFAAMVATLYGTTFALVHAAAAAQIDFSSANHATPLRILMLLQQACFCGWLAVPAVLHPDQRAAHAAVAAFRAVVAGAAYWFAMGALTTGEWPLLSRRVQRSLPQSPAARLWLTWFNPGPGAGYFFAVANLTALTALAVGAMKCCGEPAAVGFAAADFDLFALLAWSYVVAYLGFGRLLIVLARRWAFVPMAAALLIQIILVLAGIGVPILIDALAPGNGLGGYSSHHRTNPFWTLKELWESGSASVQGSQAALLLGAAAAAALLLNLRTVGGELHRYRIATPMRVLDEQLASPDPSEKTPRSPWDEPPPGDSSMLSPTKDA